MIINLVNNDPMRLSRCCSPLRGTHLASERERDKRGREREKERERERERESCHAKVKCRDGDSREEVPTTVVDSRFHGPTDQRMDTEPIEKNNRLCKCEYISD